jgi:hypothetical protein
MASAFRLLPFDLAPALADLRLDVGVQLEPAQLRIHYRLEGPLHRLAIPATHSGPPQRRDGLWQATCFEAFIAQADQPGYWEINLSPSGDWNVYRLDGYREGLRAEAAIQALAWTAQRSPQQLHLDLCVPLAPLVGERQPSPALELGITAVLQERNGSCSYWAIRHTGPEADFHRRDSFIAL